MDILERVHCRRTDSQVRIEIVGKLHAAVVENSGISEWEDARSVNWCGGEEIIVLQVLWRRDNQWIPDSPDFAVIVRGSSLPGDPQMAATGDRDLI